LCKHDELAKSSVHKHNNPEERLSARSSFKHDGGSGIGDCSGILATAHQLVRENLKQFRDCLTNRKTGVNPDELRERFDEHETFETLICCGYG
jgi:hypothetical protein